MYIPPQGLSSNLIKLDPSGNTALFTSAGSEIFYVDSSGNIYVVGNISKVSNTATVQKGIQAMRGADMRIGIGSADASAITLVNVPADSPYIATVGLVGNGGTITSAVYTLSYSDRLGNTISQTVSISSVTTESTMVHAFWAKGGTAIKGQLTTLSGTSPNVDITCIVEAVGTTN